MCGSLRAVALSLFLAQLGLSAVQSADSCAAAQQGGPACAVEAQDDLDTTSALQIGREQAKRVEVHDHGARPRRAPTPAPGPAFECPFLPEDQPLRQPVTVESPVTLEVVPMKVCDGNDASQTWYTRAYALPGHEPTIPGPTIVVKPGETLDITVVNKLGLPNYDCKETAKGQGGGFLNPNQLVAFCDVNTTNLHLHGLHVSPKPGADYVLHGVPPGESERIVAELPKNHASGTNWYHPHNHHSVAAQAGGGMMGAIVVKDPAGLVPQEISALESKIVFLTLVDMMGSQTSKTGSSSPVIEEKSRGNLFKDPEGKLVYRPNTFYMLANGMYKPTMTVEDGQWMRLNLAYATIEYNIIANWRAWDEASTKNGFYCELGLLAKDGIYLSVAPRVVEKVYLASGNRADVAMKCGCKEGWSGTCDGVLFSSAELDAAKGSGGNAGSPSPPPAFPFPPFMPPASSTSGPFGGVGQPTVEQDFLYITVEQSSRKPDGALPEFSVKRPCYLVDLTGVDPAPENKGVISLPKPQMPTNPQWQVVYWSNFTTPEKFIGQPFTHAGETPPLATWKLGTVQELQFAGEPRGSSQPPAYHISGLAQHPIHMHVSQYQIVKLRCADGKWITSGGCAGSNFYEVGDWHDTLMQSGGWATVRFQASSFGGPWVLHCHILSHEDEGMMGYFNVEGQDGTQWAGAKEVDPTCYEGYFAE